MGIWTLKNNKIRLPIKPTSRPSPHNIFLFICTHTQPSLVFSRKHQKGLLCSAELIINFRIFVYTQILIEQTNIHIVTGFSKRIFGVKIDRTIHKESLIMENKHKNNVDTVKPN